MTLKPWDAILMKTWGLLLTYALVSCDGSKKRGHLLALLSAHLEALSKQYNFTL